MIKKILITFSILFTLFAQTSLHATSNDPFTRILGDGEVVVNKNTKNIKKKQTPISSLPTDTNIKFRIKSIGNNLSPDPLISYNLIAYRLKGTALSSIHKMKKNYSKSELSLNKIDYGKIPTTHKLTNNDTIDSVAMQYGYLPEEIKIANSLVPGSKLIIGNRIVLPSRFHVVQKNQSLDMIAELHNVKTKDLIGLNNLKKNYELIINEKLLLPFYIYKTKKIQTIKEIAKQFDRTKEEILSINNLSGDEVLDHSQQIKIPIFVNLNQEGKFFKNKGIVNYTINPRNLAILEINKLQYMVKEGDLLGNKNGRIVSITNKEMKVLENQEEFIFQINAPITAQVASLSSSSLPPEVVTTVSSVDKVKTSTNTKSSSKKEEVSNKTQVDSVTPNTNSKENKTTVTDIEDIFK
jgi:LysM repeat protein